MVTSAICDLNRRPRRGRGHDLVASLPAQWPKYVGAGACLTGAYGLVLVAVKHAPVGYVATLRESSVVMGAAMGWLLLHEPLGGRRLVSSAGDRVRTRRPRRVPMMASLRPIADWSVRTT